MASSHDSVQALIRVALDDENKYDVQVAAIEGLGFAGGFYARATLLGILSDTNSHHELRVAAARALGHASNRE